MFSGSLVALVTPMRQDGSLDMASLERLVDWHVEQGTHGLVIAGTTGESATLSKDEHVEVVRIAAARAAKRVPVIAGIGSNSTSQTIDLSKAVRSLPIDGYLVVVPYYNKPTQEGIYRHFTAIADAVDKPIMLYNVPGRTVADMKPATVARLASHAQIFGVKEATGEVARVREIRDLCGPDFRLYSGDDATAREFMQLGGHGVVSVTANVAPAGMAAMCNAALAGDHAAAAQADRPITDLHRDLFAESNPIPVKWALARMGKIAGGIRLPLTPLSSDAQPTVEAAMRTAGLL